MALISHLAPDFPSSYREFIGRFLEFKFEDRMLPAEILDEFRKIKQEGAQELAHEEEEASSPKKKAREEVKELAKQNSSMPTLSFRPELSTDSSHLTFTDSNRTVLMKGNTENEISFLSKEALPSSGRFSV